MLMVSSCLLFMQKWSFTDRWLFNYFRFKSQSQIRSINLAKNKQMGMGGFLLNVLFNNVVKTTTKKIFKNENKILMLNKTT